MKKSMVFVLGVVLILSLSFISAGFFSDFWEKISGEVVNEGDTEPVSLSCEDSDGGRNYFEKGTTFNDVFTGTDKCIDETYLVEYFCSSTVLFKVYGEVVNCAGDGNSCEEGRCVLVAFDPIECTLNSDCGDLEICENSQCIQVECKGDGDCTGDEVCDLGDNVCVGCLDDGDCASGEVCNIVLQCEEIIPTSCNNNFGCAT